MQAQIPILIVDDKASNRLALKAILDRPEYALVEAASGEEALRRILEQPFAALLVDVRMPGMDGFELAELVRARDKTHDTPILFLTAEAAEPSSISRGYRLGAVDYLVKPLVAEVVQAKVAVFVDLYRARVRVEEQGRELLAAEHKAAELRLLTEKLSGERRYRHLAEAVPHIVWTAEADGTVEYFNPRWFELTGDRKKEWPLGFLPFLHPDDLQRAEATWTQALETGRACEFEARLRGADGRYRWQLGRALPELSASGNVVSWLGTFTDIEHQKQAQQILAEFKGTLDAVLDAVFIFDPLSWRLEYLNHGAEALMGLSDEQLRQMRTLDLLPEYSEEEFRALLDELARTRRSVAVQTTVKGSGTEVPIELSLQQISVDGNGETSSRLVGIGRDISDRKQAEAERERLYQGALDAIRSRDEFLSVASHELKTPLTALRLHLEALSRRLAAKKTPEEAVPEALLAKVDLANRQIGRLATLIEELLDVSRIRTGRLRVELQPDVDLREVVREVVARHEAELRRAECTVKLDAPEPVMGQWDRSRLDQVVTNLLTNAIKFAPGGPIEISVKAEGGQARLSVRDHGHGIPPALQQRIFGRFERAVSSRNYGGLGLGLYIVKQVLGAHGGDVRVESSGRPGEGAKFVVELPRSPGSAPERGEDVVH